MFQHLIATLFLLASGLKSASGKVAGAYTKQNFRLTNPGLERIVIIFFAVTFTFPNTRDVNDWVKYVPQVPDLSASNEITLCFWMTSADPMHATCPISYYNNGDSINIFIYASYIRLQVGSPSLSFYNVQVAVSDQVQWILFLSLIIL